MQSTGLEELPGIGQCRVRVCSLILGKIQFRRVASNPHPTMEISNFQPDAGQPDIIIFRCPGGLFLILACPIPGKLLGATGTRSEDFSEKGDCSR